MEKLENKEFKLYIEKGVDSLTAQKICQWVVNLKTKNPYLILDSLKKEFPMLSNRERDLISFVVRDNEEIKTWCALYIGNEMDSVTRAIQIIDGLPVALQQYVAKFILETLPNIPGNDAGNVAIKQLHNETGLDNITCKFIVHGWLFDLHNVLELKSKSLWK